MNSIVVTVRGKRAGMIYDFDLPLDKNGKELADDLFDALREINPEYNYMSDYHGILIEKQQRFLKADESLGDAGVFNGDYLTIIPFP